MKIKWSHLICHPTLISNALSDSKRGGCQKLQIQWCDHAVLTFLRIKLSVKIDPSVIHFSLPHIVVWSLLGDIFTVIPILI